MHLASYASPADHPAAVYLHGLNVWAVRVRGRAAAVAAASAKGWTAFRFLGDWFVSDQKPDQAGARELLGRMVPNPANLSRADDAIAVVPDQQAIAYKGFTVKMRPSQFLALCPQRALPPSKRLEDAVRSGLPIGPPFLEVAWDESAKRWQVYGHEGRGRAIAILKHFGDEPIEIDVLPQYLRARDLTPEMRRAPFVKDVRSNPVVGDVVKCDGRCCEAEVPAIAFAQAGWQRRRDESGEVIFLCPSCYDDYLETKIQGFRHNPPVTPPQFPSLPVNMLSVFKQHGGRILKFKALPVDAQKAIVHYMAVDGEAWEANEPLSFYVRKYGGVSFGYVLLPMQVLVRQIQGNMDDFTWRNFDEYHKWYLGGGGVPHHKSAWPVLLADERGEVLQDGWHRFHDYYRRGLKTVPAVAYVRGARYFRGRPLRPNPVTPPPPPGAVGDRGPGGGGSRCRRPLKKCILCGALADTSGLCFRCKHPEVRGKPRA